MDRVAIQVARLWERPVTFEPFKSIFGILRFKLAEDLIAFVSPLISQGEPQSGHVSVENRISGRNCFAGEGVIIEQLYRASPPV